MVQLEPVDKIVRIYTSQKVMKADEYGYWQPRRPRGAS